MCKWPLVIIVLGTLLGTGGCGSDDSAPTGRSVDPIEEIDPDPNPEHCLTAVVGLRLEGPTDSPWQESGGKVDGLISQFAGESVLYTVVPEWTSSPPPDCSYEVRVDISRSSQAAVSSSVVDDDDDGFLGFRLTTTAPGTYAIRLQLVQADQEVYASNWAFLRVEPKPRIAGVEIYALGQVADPLLYRNLNSVGSEPAVFFKKNTDQAVRIALLSAGGETLPERMFYSSYSVEIASSDESLIRVVSIPDEPARFRLVSSQAGNGSETLSFNVRDKDQRTMLDLSVPVLVDVARWAPRFTERNAPNGFLEHVAVYGDRLVVTGYFDKVGNLPARNIAQWDGESWSALGEGVAEGSSIVADEERLLVGDPERGYLEWKEPNWVPHSPPVPDGGPPTAATFFAGDLHAGSTISRWDGLRWTSTFDADGFKGATALTTHEGRLHVAANFDRYTVRPRQRWSSAAELTLGQPTIWQELFRAPAQEMILFVESVPSGFVVGWFVWEGSWRIGRIDLVRGTTRSTIAEGLGEVVGAGQIGDELFIIDDTDVYSQSVGFDVPIGTASRSRSLRDAVVYKDQLYVVGYFTLMSGVPSQHIAVWTD